MFNPENNPEDDLQPLSAYSPDQPTGLSPDLEADTEEVVEEVPETDIHTMPKRYLKPAKLPKQKGKISWVILAILIFVVLAAVIAVVIIFLTRQASPSLNTNDQLANLNQPAANDNTNNNQNQNQNLNQNQNVNQPETTAQERDEQRLQHLMNMRDALAMFFNDQDIFPYSLNTLVDQYLVAVPVNPTPGGEAYSYQVADGQLDYQLSFSLESGGVLGATRLAAGTFVATANRVMTMSEWEANQNVNVNQNLNINVNQPVTPPITLPTLGLDSDGDQLTDIEENVYQTNSALADTDDDGFTDATEILNFYNPTVADGRLMDSGLIEVYQNQVFNYSLLYPQAWSARNLTTDNREVIFTSSTGEFVEIIVLDNPQALSAYNWYLNQNPGIDTSGINTILIDGLPALQTADSLNTYLAAGTKIYALVYNIGTGNQMNFQTTYQLFLKSFMFITPGSTQ